MNIKNITAIFVLFSIAILGQSQKNSILHKEIFFQSDKFSITEEHQKVLDRLLDTIANLEVKEIKISGHADNKGDSTYNMNLSAKRTHSIRKYLTKNSEDIYWIQSSYFGENKPQVCNNLALNRRVDIDVSYSNHYGHQDSSKISCLPQKPCIPINDGGERNDTLIRLPEGTLISGNKGDINTIMSDPALKEYSSMVSLSMAGIHTHSEDGDVLVSGGMLRLSQNNEKICFDNKVTVRFPVSKDRFPKGARPTLWVANPKGNWENESRLKLVKTKEGDFYEYTARCFSGSINCDVKFTTADIKIKAKSVKQLQRAKLLHVNPNIAAIGKKSFWSKKVRKFKKIPLEGFDLQLLAKAIDDEEELQIDLEKVKIYKMKTRKALFSKRLKVKYIIHRSAWNKPQEKSEQPVISQVQDN